MSEITAKSGCADVSSNTSSQA